MRIFRISIRGLMEVVAAVAMIISIVFLVLEAHESLKREIWVRVCVLEDVDQHLNEARTKIVSFANLIRRTEGQDIDGSRTSHWIQELSWWRSVEADYATSRPKYERLAWRPWESFLPDSFMGDVYRGLLNRREPPLYIRSFDHAYRRWSMCLALFAGATLLGIIAVVAGIERLRLLGTIETEPKAFSKTLLPWLCGVTASAITRIKGS